MSQILSLSCHRVCTLDLLWYTSSDFSSLFLCHSWSLLINPIIIQFTVSLSVISLYVYSFLRCLTWIKVTDFDRGENTNTYIRQMACMGKKEFECKTCDQALHVSISLQAYDVIIPMLYFDKHRTIQYNIRKTSNIFFQGIRKILQGIHWFDVYLLFYIIVISHYVF